MWCGQGRLLRDLTGRAKVGICVGKSRAGLAKGGQG